MQDTKATFSHKQSHAVLHQQRRFSGLDLPVFIAQLLNISFSGLPRLTVAVHSEKYLYMEISIDAF